jgi:mRNA-degrading endonuclease toxin of MazEF toxin-antitoxin module
VVTPRRGEIWWVRQSGARGQAGDRSTGRRPYVVVSGDPWNLEPRYPRVTVCPLTGAERVTRRYETDVVVRKHESRLSKDSVVRCVEIYTVFRDALEERVARLPELRVRELERALATYLSLALAGG